MKEQTFGGSGDDSLMLAKLARPLLPFDHIARSDLVDRLKRVYRQRLTCLCAPIGYGKTTLLVEFSQAIEADARTSWLSVDQLDREPDRFWSHFRAALKRLASNSLPQGKFEDAGVAGLCNALFGLADDFPESEFVLFIDGFEAVKGSDVEIDFFGFLEGMPPQMHVILAADCLSPRMQAELYRLGRVSFETTDLAFTYEELRRFFEQESGLVPSGDILDDVLHQTEGWPQGIALAAGMALRGSRATQEFSFNGSNRLVRQYFKGQVLSGASEEAIEFLVQVSILERFNLQLCDTVLDGENASECMVELIEKNLFVVPCDDGTGWYRLHRLFADMLRSEFAESRVEAMRSLSMRACVWFYECGYTNEAAKYLLLASDFSYIENLTEAICSLSRKNKSESGRLWLLRISAERMESSPLLCMMVAWSFVTNARVSDALEWIKKFEQCIQREENRSLLRAEDIEFASMCLTMKCLSMAGEGKKALEMCEDLLGGRYVIKPSLMSMIYQSLGEAYERIGEMKQAQEVYLQGQASASVDATMHQYIFNAFNYAGIQFLFGEHDDVVALCRRLLEKCPADFPLYGAVGSLLARALLEKNEIDSVPEIIARSLKRVSPYRHIDMYLEAKIAQARYLVSLGRLSDAYETIVEALLRGERHDVPRAVLFSVYCTQAEIATRRHNSRDLRIIEQKFIPRVRKDDMYGMALLLMVRAFAAREKGDADLALSFLDDAIERAERAHLVRTQLKALVEKVLVLADRGDGSCAQATLNDVLLLASRHGFLRSLLDAGEPMRMLLRERAVVRRAGEGVRAYVKSLLLEFEKEAPCEVRSGESEKGILGEGLTPLTQRELEIFHLLNLGMSRQEISETLCISLNTAKKHLANIYAKLDVNTREEALKKFSVGPFA